METYTMRSMFAVAFDEVLNKSTFLGEYWTVPGVEGDHVLNFTTKVVTDSITKAAPMSWFFTTYAFQRKAPFAAPAGDGAAPAVDTVWDTIISGQKLVAASGWPAAQVTPYESVFYSKSYPADAAFEPGPIWIATKTAIEDITAAGNWAVGAVTQGNEAGVYTISEAFSRGFAASGFDLKGGDRLEVRVGVFSFSNNTTGAQPANYKWSS